MVLAIIFSCQSADIQLTRSDQTVKNITEVSTIVKDICGYAGHLRKKLGGNDADVDPLMRDMLLFMEEQVGVLNSVSFESISPRYHHG